MQSQYCMQTCNNERKATEGIGSVINSLNKILLSTIKTQTDQCIHQMKTTMTAGSTTDKLLKD